MRLQHSGGYRPRVVVLLSTRSRWSVRPILIVNPRSDVRFAQLVAELTADGMPDPVDLQARLRAEHPRAVVRRRELSSESIEMWYVYRDGRWSPD
jgi:hypothetical protein